MAQYNTANSGYFSGENSLHEVVMVAYANGAIVDNFSAGYTGSIGGLGYTGSIGYTGSRGVTGYTGSVATVAGYTGSYSVNEGANIAYFVDGLNTAVT